MYSLGREPQERPLCIDWRPRGAADSVSSVSCGHFRVVVCRRSAAVGCCERENRGSRPGLSIFRRSAARNQPDNAFRAINHPPDDRRAGEAAHQGLSVFGKHRRQKSTRGLGIEAKVDS